MNKTLPQICVKCRKLKMPDLGSFKKRAGTYAGWYWICHACQSPGDSLQRPPATKATWLERKVIPVLIASGHRWIREYQMDKFRFDFAIPKLMLLIEADSRGYHRRKDQIRRDMAKKELAESKGWKVVRVRDPDIEGWTRRAIDRRVEAIDSAKCFNEA